MSETPQQIVSELCNRANLGPKQREDYADMLGVRAEDEVHDLFPGTGVLSKVVKRRRQWLEGRVLYEPEALL